MERGVDGAGGAVLRGPGAVAGERRSGADGTAVAAGPPAVRTVVQAAVGVAVWAIAVLHVAGVAGAVDPLRHTVSDYVVLPGGHLVLGIAAAAMALAGAALATACHRRGTGRLPVLLLGSWAVAMAVAGIFPTNPPGTPADVAAAVHRYAGAWVFAVLPVAVLLIARGPAVHAAARRRLTGLAVAAGASAGVFLLAHVPIVVFGSPAFPLLGGVERVLYGVLAVLLVVTARSIRTGVAP
ncbi:DUF998 domain-containing protein [Pseudonocardia xishanensis]